MAEKRRATNRVEVNPGDRYGAWEVIEELEPMLYPGKRSVQRRMRCLCTDCGVAIKVVRLPNLRSGRSTRCVSCGCRKAAIRTKRHHNLVVNGLIKQLPELPESKLRELVTAASQELKHRATPTQKQLVV